MLPLISLNINYSAETRVSSNLCGSYTLRAWRFARDVGQKRNMYTQAHRRRYFLCVSIIHGHLSIFSHPPAEIRPRVTRVVSKNRRMRARWSATDLRLEVPLVISTLSPRHIVNFGWMEFWIKIERFWRKFLIIEIYSWNIKISRLRMFYVFMNETRKNWTFLLHVY